MPFSSAFLSLIPFSLKLPNGNGLKQENLAAEKSLQEIGFLFLKLFPGGTFDARRHCLRPQAEFAFEGEMDSKIPISWQR
jgi:hypothetical protein